MNKQGKSNELALSKVGKGTPDVLDLNLSSNITESLELLKRIVSSKRLGDKVTTVEGALSAYVKTKELGLPFISGVEHMFDINGKSSLDVHAMRALVLRAGTIHWSEEYSFVPLYKYIDNAKQVIAKGVDETCLPDVYELLKGNTEEEQKKEYQRITSIGKQIVLKSMDRVVYAADGAFVFNYAVKYKFTRWMPAINKELIEYGEFSIAEAFAAGLHLKKDGSININSPWLCYPRNMLEHRAWTFGARKIADDILFGLLENTELMDIEKVDYTLNDGRVEVIKADVSDN